MITWNTVFKIGKIYYKIRIAFFLVIALLVLLFIGVLI